MKKQYIEKAMKLDLQKERQQGKEKEEWNGLAEGKVETKNEIAKKMKNKGMDIETIVELTGLTNEEIEKL